MREDMAKVIVERPRFGSRIRTRKGLRRRDQRVPPDEFVRRAPMLGRVRRDKSLNEHLGPLRRYLHRQVGRPWNLVFSEICAHINRNSAVQDHVRDHVEDFVELHVIEINGVPCHGDARRYARPLGEFGAGQFYVCPRTGLLRTTKYRWKRTNRAIHQLRQFIRLNAFQQYHRLNGRCYLVTLKPLPQHPHRFTGKEHDVVLNQPIHYLREAQLIRAYGQRCYAVAKRLLGKKELRQSIVPTDWWR